MQTIFNLIVSMDLFLDIILVLVNSWDLWHFNSLTVSDSSINTNQMSFIMTYSSLHLLPGTWNSSISLCLPFRTIVHFIPNLCDNMSPSAPSVSVVPHNTTQQGKSNSLFNYWVVWAHNRTAAAQLDIFPSVVTTCPSNRMYVSQPEYLFNKHSLLWSLYRVRPLSSWSMSGRPFTGHYFSCCELDGANQVDILYSDSYGLSYNPTHQNTRQAVLKAMTCMWVCGATKRQMSIQKLLLIDPPMQTPPQSTVWSGGVVRMNHDTPFNPLSK